MTPERWRQIKDALAAALARPSSERAAFLRSLHASDADLAGEVESLLAHDSNTFLEEPAIPVWTPSPGATFGPYRLQSALGEGGMGIVYLAEDSTLERPVALKFLSHALEQQEEARRRFLAEAKAAAALDHPYICKIYQTGEHDRRPFIAMEYIRGETLRQRLDSGQLVIAEALRIMIEVTEALETAHVAHIVHRDLKPSNIMLTVDGHVKVLDFGLAKRVGGERAVDTKTQSAVTSAGVVRGTVAYMSPEQVRGQDLDLRSDLFSLGVVLYEAIAAGNPFMAGSALETASQILHYAPPPIAQVRSDVPAMLDEVVQRLLAKAPDDRFRTAGDVRGELLRVREAIARGGDIDAPASRATIEDSPGRVVVSRRVALGAMAATAVALPAGAWWWTHRQSVAGGSRSIAVLPFANVSGDEANDYLATGIPRALTARLQRAGLRVIPWETASRFRDSSNPIDVAKTLQVSSVLSGSLQTAKGRVIVNVSLVDGTTGFLSWSDEFASSDDLFDVQTQIARGVATALGNDVSGDRAATLARPESKSKDAYDFYLQGAEYLNDGDREATDIAFDYFTRAVALDPDLVEAHVGLGAVYLERYWSGWGGGARNLELAAQQFQTALKGDSKDMRARRGQILIEFYRGREEDALRLAQDAARVGGDDVETLLARAEAHSIIGPSDLALPLLERVRALDPGNEAAAWLQTIAYFRTERFRETAAAASDYTARFGDDSFMSLNAACALERLNDLDGARVRLEPAITRLMRPAVEIGTISAYDLAALVGAGVFTDVAGRRERAQELWRRGLQLTRDALATASDSVGTRVFYVTFLGYLGEQTTFANEVASARAMLDAANLNPWELVYLVGAYAHLGDAGGALELLRRMLRQGRCVGRAWIMALAPSLRSAAGLSDLVREYRDVEERRRRQFRMS